MSSHQGHCGTFVIDPFDIETDCCMHVHEPLRPHQTAVSNLTLTNHEEVRVEGTINWKLADAATGEVVDDLEDATMPFDLESGEEKTYDLDIVPEDSNVLHTRINESDDQFVATTWYALEEVRAPDEERDHYGGEPSSPPQ